MGEILEVIQKLWK